MGEMADMMIDQMLEDFHDGGQEQGPIHHDILRKVHDTCKAYLLEDKKGEFWIAKSVCTLNEAGKEVLYPDWVEIKYVG